jgi:flagella basal body P-ring formation protein FlgA
MRTQSNIENRNSTSGTHIAFKQNMNCKRLIAGDNTMRKRLHLLLLAFPLSLIVLNAQAAETAGIQSHESILDAARQFMETYSANLHDMPAEIHMGRLDSRLHLVECGEALETFLPSGGRTLGNTTVGVRCSRPKSWTLYVPVTVSIFKQVVVTTDALPRGTVLNSRQVKVARRNLAKLPQGYYVDPQSLVGMKLKRNVSGGLPLTPMMVEAPEVIKRGQRVTLISRGSGITVRMPGQAMANASAGEHIRVKNLSSKRIVEGVVTASGEVQVGI